MKSSQLPHAVELNLLHIYYYRGTHFTCVLECAGPLQLSKADVTAHPSNTYWLKHSTANQKAAGLSHTIAIEDFTKMSMCFT